MTDQPHPAVIPAVVLVRPQMGENIGAAARAMLNFGLTHLRVVAPRDGWPNPAAVAMASGAGRILDEAMLTETTADALTDLDHVYATTARPRGLTKHVLTPAEAMADARARMASGARIGLLFGPERAGLENADIVLAQTIVTVPVNPDFPSLNLAQCVLLLAYEWRHTATAPAETLHLPSRTRPANRTETLRLADRLVERLDARGFFWPEHKRDSLEENLRNLIGRLELTDTDIRTLHGVFRCLDERDPT